MLKRITLGCAAAALTLGLTACEEPLQVASGLYRAPDGSLSIVASACAGHGIDGATWEDDTHTDGNPNNVNSMPVDFHYIFWSHDHGTAPDFATIPLAGGEGWKRHQLLYALLPGHSYGVSASEDGAIGTEVSFTQGDLAALSPGQVRWDSRTAKSVMVTMLADFKAHACDGLA
jgi:hypothetical protein